MLKNEKYSEETVVETHRTKKGAKARKQRIKEQATSKPKKKQKTMFPCDTRKHSLFETNGNLRCMRFLSFGTFLYMTLIHP